MTRLSGIRLKSTLGSGRHLSKIESASLRILILGSGAREHALAAAIKKSKHVSQLYTAPGNPGCGRVGENVSLDIMNSDDVRRFCLDFAIDLVVVGPEGPLVAGVADVLQSAGVNCLGPSRSAARLEGSKGFAKDFCREFGIPTAGYARFSEFDTAAKYVQGVGAPLVVKADGLASGKGVVVAQTLEEAERALRACFDGVFGSAGSEVVVEEFLEGEEVSFFALCDGRTAVPFGVAQDHKRAGDGDLGPNTGGMGAYSPTSLVDGPLCRRIMAEIVTPTVRGMAEKGAPFRGILFVGLMINQGEPKVVEFNVRFGDPEAEAILARLDADLIELFSDAARGALGEKQPKFASASALTVVMATRGYPGPVSRGSSILGLQEAESVPGVSVFQAGTRLAGRDLLADGGRVLAITATGRDIIEAQSRAYDAVDRINWSDGFCRRDIGWRELRRTRRTTERDHR